MRRSSALAAARKAAALEFVERGFYVLPVNDKKEPHARLVPHGFKNATRDPQVVQKWFAAEPGANVAIACGLDYGLFVVDVDVKNGAPGKDSLRRLLTERHPTLIAKTPSGGLHLYYKHPQTLLRAKHPEYPGIDFKGASGGGYVLAPPSELRNGPYAWLNPTSAIAELPESMLARLMVAESTEIPGTLARAFRNLPAESLWPTTQQAIPEGRRHDSLVSLAGSLRRTGLTPQAIEASLIEQNKTACRPPLPEAEVRRIAMSSAKWQPAPAAAPATPAIVLSPLPPDWLNIQPPDQEFTWNPWLPLGSVALLVGEGAVGKTQLLMRIAAHIATGRSLFDSDVQPGRVVYLGLEDPPAVLRRRLYYLNASMRQQFDPTISESLLANLVAVSLVGQQFHLVTMNGGAVGRSASVESLIESVGNAHLVVLDPLSRLHGCEENSNAVSTAIVNSCERIAQETGAAVLLGHHTGKAAAREGLTDAYAARGGSGLADAARSVLRLIVATKADAKGLDLDMAAIERREYLRLLHAKSNYAQSAPAVWLQKSSTGELRHVLPIPIGAPAHDELVKRLRAWWLNEWERQPFSRETVRKEFKSIFGDDISRGRAEAVLDRAIDGGAFDNISGGKNPRSKRYVFRSAVSTEMTGNASGTDTRESRDDTRQDPPRVSAETEREKSGGGEQSRRGLSPYKRRRVSRNSTSLASMTEDNVLAETPTDNEDPPGQLDPPGDRPHDGPADRPIDRSPDCRLKQAQNWAPVSSISTRNDTVSEEKSEG
jgi:hypothetical protein